MILFVRKPRSFAYRFFQSLNSLYLRSTPIQTVTQQSSSSDLSAPICNTLTAKGANWDTLTAKFPSLTVNDSLVEQILIYLREPSNARKALTFFHWSSQTRNFRHGLRSYCLIVHILVSAGLLTDAQALLQSCVDKNPAAESSRLSVAETILTTYELALPGPRVFDLLIQTYSRMRMVETAFDACCYFSDHGFVSSLVSFNAMLHVAQKSDMNDFAWKVYEYMLERSVYPNKRTVEIMVDVMCKEGSLRKMADVSQRIHGRRCGPEAIVNLTLAFRLIREDRIYQGIALGKRLLQKKLILDDVMSSLIIYSYCKMGNLDLAYEVYDDMVKRGLGSNAFVHTSFIGAYCRSGEIDEAVRLTEEMAPMGLKPYDETFNSLIEGCSRLGRLDDSLDFYEKMLKQGFLPDCATCNEMMGSLCEAGLVEKGNEILTVLVDRGFIPDQLTYLKLMDGYGKTGNAQGILKLYYEMEYKGIKPDIAVFTSLIRNLCQCGKLKEAEKILTVMEERCVSPSRCVFHAIVEGFCRKGEIEQALYFYDEMIGRNIEPCAHTFTMLLWSMAGVKSRRCNCKMLENTLKVLKQ